MKEINSKQFRNLSRVPGSNIERGVQRDNCTVCIIFGATGQRIAESVMQTVRGSREVKYFSFS